MLRTQRAFSLLAAVALIGASLGCSSTRVYANHDPQADFGAYETYGFPEDLPTDGPSYGSLLSRFLKAAASRELEARGYRRSEEPDLLVYFHVQTRERVRTTYTPSLYYSYRPFGWSTFGGYDTIVTHYTEGTLNVDLVDRRRDELVWEGAVVGRVTDEVREDLREEVDEAVHDVFAEYPFVAGKRGPS